jgi:hypothetical protein
MTVCQVLKKLTRRVIVTGLSLISSLTEIVRSARVEEAFATVRREDYLGLEPWPILRRAGYVNPPDADPVYLSRRLILNGRGLAS